MKVYRAKRADKTAVAGSRDHFIRLQDVTKAYTNAAGRFVALKALDLHIGEGEFVAIVGRSGSGKSTLLNLLAGIDRPTAGEVYINGAAVHTLNEEEVAVWRGRNIGVVFQFFQLLPTLTIIENVMMPMDFINTIPVRQRQTRAMHLLQQVGVADQARKFPAMLSGGQQQRVAIARALANDPSIIVADEPTGNLDSHTAEQVFHLFEALVGEGKTLIVVTHEREVSQWASRVVTLADGRIVNHTIDGLSAKEKTKNTPPTPLKRGVSACTPLLRGVGGVFPAGGGSCLG